MTIALSVNLNKIALIRNSREGNYPNIAEFGRSCLHAGAQGLTIHPRPDQRHIRVSDVPELATLIKNFPKAEYNIEGNPFADPEGDYPGLLALVEAAKPTQCTLVPDANDQLTSDHGFDLTEDSKKLVPVIKQLQAWGVRVSIFVDPDLDQIGLAKQLGANRVELYTGPYAKAFAKDQTLFKWYSAASEYAAALGMGVNAGHDLNLENMREFSKLPHLSEVSIGHALTVDALKMGFSAAVKTYLSICS